MSEVKQVLVYRRDLKMRKGKIAAQCAHASMMVFFNRKIRWPGFRPLRPPTPGTTWGDNVDRTPHLLVPLTPEMDAWVNGLFTKIVLTVETEDDLLRAYELAKAAGIPCALVTDAGKTEFHGVPTHTTVALGPAKAEDIDKITGPEPLGAVRTKLP